MGGVVSSGASKAWEAVCRSFADAAMFLLKWFADAFVSFPDTDVRSVTSTYAISMWIAGIIAALLLIGQVIRTAVTHDGSALAHGLVGAAKALLAVIATLTVAHTALVASDEIAQGIIDRSLGGNEGLKKSLTGLFQFAGNPTPGTATTIPMSLVFVLAIVGIILTGVLWFEMLLRNAAIAVLVATAPIAAAGQIAESTRSWWTKACAATVQLIILKPIITLIFALGFGIAGTPADTSKPADLVTILSGLLILLVAVVAWPVIARFFTFATVSFAGGGLAGMLGFAAGRANAGSGPAGVNPAQFAQATEARTMATSGANSMTATESVSAAGAGGGAASGGAAAGAGAALGAAALPLAVAAAGVDMAQRAVNSLTGRMEQIAGHAGIHGAHPHARPAGHSQYHGSWTNPGSGGSHSHPAPPVTPDRSSAAVPAPSAAPDSRGHDTAADPGPPPPIAEPTHTSAIEYTTPFDNSGPIEEVGR